LWTDALGAGDPRLAILDQVSILVSDLARRVLGSAKKLAPPSSSTGRPAGWGWFVDPTPNDNSEFLNTPVERGVTANPSSAAYGRMDLLTTVGAPKWATPMGSRRTRPGRGGHDVAGRERRVARRADAALAERNQDRSMRSLGHPPRSQTPLPPERAAAVKQTLILSALMALWAGRRCRVLSLLQPYPADAAAKPTTTHAVGLGLRTRRMLAFQVEDRTGNRNRSSFMERLQQRARRETRQDDFSNHLGKDRLNVIEGDLRVRPGVFGG